VVLLGLYLAATLSGCGSSGGNSASDALVLIRVVEGTTDVVRVRLADGAALPLTETPDRDEIWPYWSEPAKRLVFQVISRDGDSDLLVWSEPLGEKFLDATRSREERWPAWSPVGLKLAYAFRSEGVPSNGIAVADFSSGEHQILGPGGAQHWFLRPSWSPNGAAVLAQRKLKSGRGSNLWLLKPLQPPEQLTHDRRWIDFKPFFTRDGASIVYSRKPSAGGASQIVQLVIGGDKKRLAAFEGSSDHSARPSPTRDEVAFVSDRSGRSQIYLLQLETGEMQGLCEIEGAAFAPRWSPDGELLAVTVAPPGTDEPRLGDFRSLATARVVVIDRTGAVRLDVPGLMPDWMPPWR
jgi:Tol biopolymer transport system component